VPSHTWIGFGDAVRVPCVAGALDDAGEEWPKEAAGSAEGTASTDGVSLESPQPLAAATSVRRTIETNLAGDDLTECLPS